MKFSQGLFQMMTRRVAVIAGMVSLCAALSGAANAAVLYVATNGNDSSSNPYSTSTPFRSLSKASQWANAGDTIKLRGGTYKYTDEQWIGKSGTSSAPIYVQSYDNEWAILDGSSRSSSGNVIGIGGSYVRLRWLEVKNSKGVGITIWGGANNIIQGVNVNNCQSSGIYIGYNNYNLSSTPCNNNVVDGCTAYNNCRSNQPRTLDGGWPAAIISLYARNTTVKNCDVNANWGEGIIMAVTSGGYVGYNRVHDNYSVNIYLDNATYINVDNNTIDTQYWGEYYRYNAPASGIQMGNENEYAVYNPLNYNTIKNNKIYKCSRGIYYGNYDNGGGFKNTDIFGNYIEKSWTRAAETDNANHSGSKIHDNTFKANGGTNSTSFLGTGLSVYSNSYQ